MNANVVHHVRAAIAAARLNGRRSRAGRIPKPQRPLAIEADYAARLISIVHATKPHVTALLADLQPLLDAARAARSDGIRHDAGETQRIKAAFDHARAAMAHALDTGSIEAIARRYAIATTSFQRAQLARQVHAGLGIDLVTSDKRVPAMIDHFVGENAALIRSLGQTTVGDIEKMVSRAFTSGTRAEDVAEDVADRYGIAERHARLIARDQVGKLTGQVNASRQRELGVTSFVWRTAGDERVRPEHDDLDGEEFAYDDPPDEGLPGEPVCCRCYAEPVFGEILDEADAESEQ